MALRAPTTETVVSRQVAALSRVPSPPPKRVLRYELYLRRSEWGNAAEETPGGESREAKSFLTRNRAAEKKRARRSKKKRRKCNFVFSFNSSTVAAPRSAFLFAHDTPLCYLLNIIQITKQKKNEKKTGRLHARPQVAQRRGPRGAPPRGDERREVQLLARLARVPPGAGKVFESGVLDTWTPFLRFGENEKERRGRTRESFEALDERKEPKKKERERKSAALVLERET